MRKTTIFQRDLSSKKETYGCRTSQEQKEKQPEMELTISGCFPMVIDIECVTLSASRTSLHHPFDD